jgi:hypothetical protein
MQQAEAMDKTKQRVGKRRRFHILLVISRFTLSTLGSSLTLLPIPRRARLGAEGCAFLLSHSLLLGRWSICNGGNKNEPWHYGGLSSGRLEKLLHNLLPRDEFTALLGKLGNLDKDNASKHKHHPMLLHTTIDGGIDGRRQPRMCACCTTTMGFIKSKTMQRFVSGRRALTILHGSDADEVTARPDLAVVSGLVMWARR